MGSQRKGIQGLGFLVILGEEGGRREREGGRGGRGDRKMMEQVREVAGMGREEERDMV